MKKHKGEIKKINEELSELNNLKEKIITEWRIFFLDIGVNENITIDVKNNNYESKEINKIIENFDNYGSVKKEEIISTIFKILNDNWDIYQDYKFEKYSSSKYSNLFLQLKNTPWIPTANGNYLKPFEVFFDNTINRELMGNSVNYFDIKANDNLKNQFLNDIGIIIEPSIEIIIKKLIDLSGKNEKNIELINNFYFHLDKHYEEDSYLIKNSFSEYRIIYDSNSNEYFTSKDVFWKDYSKVFGNTKGYLKKNYANLETFFLEKLDINAPNSEDYANRLIQLSKDEISQDKKSIAKHEKIIWQIYKKLNDQLNPEKVEKPISETDWWQEKDIKNISILWTYKNSFWKNDGNVFINDDDTIFSLFRDKDDLTFLKLPDNSFQKVQHFIRIFAIQYLSKSVQIELLNVIGEKENDELTKMLQHRIEYIKRYLYFKEYETYKMLTESDNFSLLKGVKIRDAQKIAVKYILNNQEVVTERKKPLIQNGKLYLLNNSQDKNSLGIELSKMLGGLKGLEDFLILLFYQKDEEIENLMVSKGIGKIPSGEFDEEDIIEDVNIHEENLEHKTVENDVSTPEENIEDETIEDDMSTHVDTLKEENVEYTNVDDKQKSDSNDKLKGRKSSGNKSRRKGSTRNISKGKKSNYDNKPSGRRQTADEVVGTPSEEKAPKIDWDTERPKTVSEKSERSEVSSGWVKKHYGYHCQICLSMESPELLTYSKSYASYDKNRKSLIQAHHLKYVGNEGHDHPGNYLSLCKHHHDLVHSLGLKLEDVNESLKFISEKEINWSDGTSYHWNLITLNDSFKVNNKPIQIVIRQDHLEELKEYIRALLK
jgi:hypothetical protein